MSEPARPPGASGPTQVLSSRLDAPPEQVWDHVGHSRFIAGYLGAQLPAAALRPGPPLLGTGRDGALLQVTVVEACPPSRLALRLSSGDTHTGLRLSIDACAQGSRLTLVHDAPDPPCCPDAGADGLSQRLAAAPSVLPSAEALCGGLGLAAARGYLAETATLVAALRRRMAPHQGYQAPAAPGFSLVQHLWHLADIEEFGWAVRFERLLDEPEPTLPGVDGDRLAIERRYQQRPWRAAADRFLRQRRRTLAALARCDAATLQRPVHFGGQACRGAEVLAALLAHDHQHRVEMAALWPPADPSPGARR